MVNLAKLRKKAKEKKEKPADAVAAPEVTSDESRVTSAPEPGAPSP